MTDEAPKKLNKKQQVFIDEYLRCFNGAEAARRAGYSDVRARQTGHELLANSDIALQIQERLSEIHMGADEALKLQADIARGDITTFFTSYGNLDFDKLRNSGMGRLVKKIKQKTVTKIGKKDDDEDTEILENEIELYPADAAQERILKVHVKFTERVDVTSGGKEIEQPKDDNARFDRAIATLANALREVVSDKSNGQGSEVDTPK